MGNYIANSINSQNFILTKNNLKVGELNYPKWYTFNAEVILSDNSKYQLKTTGIWDNKVELKQNEIKLLEFKMSWKGIIVKDFFDNTEKTYLLKQTGLLNCKFILVDEENIELIVAEADFKGNSLNYDYNIETANEFDNNKNKELLLLTTLHCINYYISIIVSVG